MVLTLMFFVTGWVTSVNYESFNSIFVPYEDAKKDVNLGNKTLSVNKINVNKVGIGTDNPNAKLEVVSPLSTYPGGPQGIWIGAGTSQAQIWQRVNGRIAFAPNVGVPTNFVDIMNIGNDLVYEFIAAGNVHIRGYSTGIQFETRGGGPGPITFAPNVDVIGKSMIIEETNGNVGIGTTNPSSKLDVNGNGHFSGNVTVDGKVSDYVEGYKIITSGMGRRVGGNVQFTVLDDRTYYGYDIIQSDAYIIWDIQKTFGHFDTLIVDSVAYKLYGTFNDSDTVIIRVDTLPSNNPVFSYWTEYIDTIALSGSGWHYQDITSSLWSAKIYGENPYKSIFLIKHLGAGSGNALNVIYMKVYYKMWR